MNPFKKATLNFLVLSLAFSSVLSPSYALAHGNDNGNGKNEDKKEKQEKKKEEKETRKQDKENKKEEKKQNNIERKDNLRCFQSFRFFFMRGWWNKNNSWNENCNSYLYELLNRFHNGTTTPPSKDTTAPVISNLNSNIGTTTAVLTWNTDENADTSVFYSTTTPVDPNSSSTKKSHYGSFSKSHYITLYNLKADTTYYFFVRSKDKAGNTSTSSESSFKTKSSSSADVTSPSLSSIAINNVGTSTLNVTWQTDEGATSKVYYSTTTPVDTSSTTPNFVYDGSLVTSHSLNITGLATSTLYRFVVESIDSSLNSSKSSEFSTTTLSN